MQRVQSYSNQQFPCTYFVQNNINCQCRPWSVIFSEAIVTAFCAETQLLIFLSDSFIHWKGISEKSFCSTNWKILQMSPQQNDVIKNKGIRTLNVNFPLMTEDKTIILTILLFKVCEILGVFGPASSCPSQEWNPSSCVRIFSHHPKMCPSYIHKNPFWKQVKYGIRRCLLSEQYSPQIMNRTIFQSVFLYTAHYLWIVYALQVYA